MISLPASTVQRSSRQNFVVQYERACHGGVEWRDRPLTGDQYSPACSICKSIMQCLGKQISCAFRIPTARQRRVYSILKQRLAVKSREDDVANPWFAHNVDRLLLATSGKPSFASQACRGWPSCLFLWPQGGLSCQTCSKVCNCICYKLHKPA